MLVIIIKENLTFIYSTFPPAVTKTTHVFSKHELHYLDVPKTGTVTVNDIFDCTFECLQSSMCLSLNLAVNKGADGKLVCELLSTDIYRSFTNFKGNISSHHFSIKVNQRNCNNVNSFLCHFIVHTPKFVNRKSVSLFKVNNTLPNLSFIPYQLI